MPGGDYAPRLVGDPNLYVRFEILPKPTYFGRQPELRLYETYFPKVAIWLNFDASHLHDAFLEDCASGLQAFDAIHVVLAAISGCDELVTTEKATSAIHRTSRIRIVSIDPLPR